MNCPVCQIILLKRKFENRDIYLCPFCSGVWLEKGELQEVEQYIISNKNDAILSTEGLSDRKVIPVDKIDQTTRKCPKCDIDLKIFNFANNSNIFLDRCDSCEGIWAEKGVLEKISLFMITSDDPVMDEYTKILSKMITEHEKSLASSKEIKSIGDDLDSPALNGIVAWPMIPLPLKIDQPAVTLAKVTIGLIAVNMLIFILQLMFVHTNEDAYFRLWGIVPFLGFSINRAYSFISSMFIHGGWEHILGNMFFLWLFGHNVEDKIGSLKFLIFYLLCGIFGGVLFCVMQPTLNDPAIGASGAISGVMGAHLVLFPKESLRVLWVGRVRTMPAIVYLLLWIFYQFIYGMVITITNVPLAVAHWAHVGGFISGLLLIHLFNRRDHEPS